jgi:hypothetical protein
VHESSAFDDGVRPVFILEDAGMALPRPRLIAAGAALVLAFGTGWVAQGWRMGAEHAALEMRYATRLAQAQENALKEYARLEKVKDDAIREAEIEAEKNAAAAAAAARAADRLRGDVAELRARIAAAPRATVDQYAATASELLADCGRELADVAAKADGHAADVRLMLAAWPR